MTAAATFAKPFWLQKNAVYVALFIFFLTLSADLINIDIGLFKLKVTHVIGCFLLLFLMASRRKLLLDKKIFFCSAWILLSIFISSLFSPLFARSFIYGLVYAFVFLIYFAVPFNFMLCLNQDTILRIYKISFLCIGSYAALQVFFSIFGIVLPFSVQKVIIVRGSGFAHEPSFYALYAIPFVVFFNVKWLLTRALNEKAKQEGREKLNEQGVVPLILANVFLLASTSTTAFFSYFVLFLVLFFFARRASVDPCFVGVRKKLLFVSALFATAFAGVAIAFIELFRKTFLKFFYSGFIHESFNDRFKGIISAFQVFCEFPGFGLGLGGVGPYLYQQQLLSTGISDFDLDRLEFHTLEPTNVFTEILASLGVFGLIGFALLAFYVWRQFKFVLKHPLLNSTEKVNVYSFLISIIVMLICLQINQGIFRGYIWTHIAISMGYLARIKARLGQGQS